MTNTIGSHIPDAFEVNFPNECISEVLRGSRVLVFV